VKNEMNPDDLQNPYAYIDESDEGVQPYVAHAPGTSGRIKADPLVQAQFAAALRDKPSGNPCANIDNTSQDAQPYIETGAPLPWMRSSHDDSTRRGLVRRPTRTRRHNHRVTDQQIEARARALHIELWRHRREIWGDDAPNDPWQILDPVKALQWKGFRVRYRAGGLGRMHWGRQVIEVAGLIDPVSRTVDISTVPPPVEQAYTLAHELGHVTLESMGTGVHRDRALNGEALDRAPDERAADKFAASFLMPQRLVRELFTAHFLTDCFELNDDTAFALRAAAVEAVRDEFPTLRDLSRHLASTNRYNGKFFPSLAERFKVSVGAMAIRLEELGLVRL
jgi:hypothetical protein